MYDKEYFRQTDRLLNKSYWGNWLTIWRKCEVESAFHLSHQSKFQLSQKFQYKKEKKIGEANRLTKNF